MTARILQSKGLDYSRLSNSQQILLQTAAESTSESMPTQDQRTRRRPKSVEKGFETDKATCTDIWDPGRVKSIPRNTYRRHCRHPIGTSAIAYGRHNLMPSDFNMASTHAGRLARIQVAIKWEEYNKNADQRYEGSTREALERLDLCLFYLCGCRWVVA